MMESRVSEVAPDRQTVTNLPYPVAEGLSVRMKRRDFLSLSGLSVGTALLSGCGGGGGSADPPQTPAPPPSQPNPPAPPPSTPDPPPATPPLSAEMQALRAHLQAHAPASFALPDAASNPPA